MLDMSQVSVSTEVCVLLYSVGWCHICSGLYTEGEGRACVGVVRWLYSSHYSTVRVVRCGKQKVMGTLDSLLLYGACLYVEGYH